MDARESRLVSLFDLGGLVGTSSSGMLVRELGQRSGDGRTRQSGGEYLEAASQDGRMSMRASQLGM